MNNNIIILICIIILQLRVDLNFVITHRHNTSVSLRSMRSIYNNTNY